MFKVTTEWLDAHRTEYGGWTDAQWNSIGATKKLRKMKGWKAHLLGGWVTYEQKDAFESASTIFSDTTIKLRNTGEK